VLAEVLAKLLRMQRLDQHDIEGVYPLYQSLLQQQERQQQQQPPQQQPLSPQQRRLAAQHSPHQHWPVQPAARHNGHHDSGGGHGPASPPRPGSSGSLQSSPAGEPPGSQASPATSPESPAAETLEHSGCGRRWHRCTAAVRLAALARCQAARNVLLELPREQGFAVLRDYMAATTAKDCSVMIALRRLPGGGSGGDCSPGGGGGPGGGADAMGSVTVGRHQYEYKVLPFSPLKHYMCMWYEASVLSNLFFHLQPVLCIHGPHGCVRRPQVAVADLDFKPLEKIEEHYELDCAIMYQAKQRRLAAVLS